MTLLSLPEGLNLLDRRTRFARLALLAYISVSAFDILVAIGQFTGAIDNESMSLSTAAALTAIFLLYVLTFAATVVLVAMWVYRAHANLRAAGIDDLAFSPGWAVGWYFVPVATFVQPFKAMRELWSVSLGQYESFGDDADPQIKLWWGTWLAGNIIAYVGIGTGLRLTVRRSVLDDLEQSPLDRKEDAGEFVAALEHLTGLAEQRPHALLGAQRGTLLDPRLRTLGSATEGREARRVAIEVHRIVAPLAGRDHAAVEVENALQLDPIETDLQLGKG
ncbi:MAG: DUF4328 domain-containing protein [Novosphingobium sp.]|nr:MAG: DUF4328 domain-containing protein [Novosphingobium sp.]